MKKHLFINILICGILGFTEPAFAQDYLCSYQAGCTYYKVFDTDAKQGYSVPQGTVIASDNGVVVNINYGWVVEPNVSQNTIHIAVDSGAQ